MDIVIVCHRNDFFLAKALVASIRYYYNDDVNIFLVKDLLNGHFSTKEMEKCFNVAVLDLGISEYGWCSAKIRVVQSKKLRGRRVLLLDADIVFTGKRLERPLVSDV